MTGRGAPAGQLAPEKTLVDVMQPGRMGMPVLVDQRRELHGARLVAGLLTDLARHGIRGRIVHVHPAPGQRPAAVRALAHQQYALCIEYAAAHVDLRGGVTALTVPQPACRADRNVELCGEEPRHQLAEPGVALAIKRVTAEGEPVLCDRLHLTRPLEQIAGPAGAHGWW